MMPPPNPSHEYCTTAYLRKTDFHTCARQTSIPAQDRLPQSHDVPVQVTTDCGVAENPAGQVTTHAVGGSPLAGRGQPRPAPLLNVGAVVHSFATTAATVAGE